MDIIDLTEDGPSGSQESGANVVDLLDDDSDDSDDDDTSAEGESRKRAASDMPDLNSEDAKKSRPQEVIVLDSDDDDHASGTDQTPKVTTVNDASTEVRTNVGGGDIAVEEVSVSANGESTRRESSEFPDVASEEAKKPAQVAPEDDVVLEDNEEATAVVKEEFVENMTDQSRRRSPVSNSIPNFILIDDSSDEEDSDDEADDTQQQGESSTARLVHQSGKSIEDSPIYRPAAKYKFHPEKQYNYGYSAHDAMKEQEKLFSQSAAKMRAQVSMLRNLKSQKNGPTFTRPVEPNKLNEKHFQWLCLHARLGLQRDATEIQVKKQYRKLALRYHPDKCRLDDAAVRFQAVTEAYHKLTRR